MPIKCLKLAKNSFISLKIIKIVSINLLIKLLFMFINVLKQK